MYIAKCNLLLFTATEYLFYKICTKHVILLGRPNSELLNVKSGGTHGNYRSLMD
jgi:hypothetical protein